MATLNIVEKPVSTPTSTYNPSDKVKDYGRKVYDQYYRVKAARSKYELVWSNGSKAWEAKRPERGEDDWQSNIVPPTTTSIIETILADMIDLNLRPFIVPVGSEDQQKADVFNHIVNFTWEKGNNDLVTYTIIKDALTKGTGVGQEYYLDDRRTVHLLKKFDPKTGEEQYVTKEVSDYNDVCLEPIPVEDLYVDPKARGFSGSYPARFAYRRYIMHIEEFRRFFNGPIWDPLGNAQYVKPGGDVSYTDLFKVPSDFDASKDVEVLWYWEKSPEDALIIVANGIVIRAGPNPYNHKQLPFARMVDLARTHEFYGKGEAELLESLQEELTLLRRMRLDQTHLSIFKPFLVSEREDLDENELLLRPAAAIHVTDTEIGIKELAISDPSRSSYMEEDRLKEDVVRASGVDDRFQSVKKATTATEAAILKESTLKHIRMKLWLMQRTFLKEVGKLRVANIQQFYTIPRLEKVLGEANTAKYQQELTQLRVSNKLQMIKGEPYEKKYREIRSKDETIEYDWKNGDILTSKKNGWSFFEAIPEMLSGNFDVQFTASPDVPISKPLKLSKLQESLANPIVMAAVESGVYDVGKVADELMKLNDIDPDELRIQQQGQGGQTMQQLAELAQIENSQMLKGQDVPSTPYSSPAHTEVHMTALKGLENADQNIIRAFSDHIMGELAAQAQRQDTLGGQGGSQLSPPMAGGAVRGESSVTPALQTGSSPLVKAGEVNKPPG